MSRVRERPSTSEAHNDFWCGMSGVHAGGDAKLLIKFAWPNALESTPGVFPSKVCRSAGRFFYGLRTGRNLRSVFLL